MTSSGTSTDGGGAKPPPEGFPLRIVILATAGVALVSGWAFILWHHHFHFTASAGVLMLGWTAVLSAVYFLWRTADNTDLDDQTDWWRATGRIEELVREKRSLLKAIKETELDRDTGKLSSTDADDILGRYRKKAIEVIKQIDLVEGGMGAGSIRERIEREVRARNEIEKARDDKKHKKGARPPVKPTPEQFMKDVTDAVAATQAEGPVTAEKLGEHLNAIVEARAAGEADDDADAEEAAP
jgi:hypothetical protein